ncbi:MAG: hypothetical protein AB7Q81_22890 [Gammaproteobacteria bacterium]
MSKSVLMVLTNPVPGQEEAFNDWYSNVHIQEVVAVPGFVAAQRFALAPAQMGGAGAHGYLALYEVEGDPAAALDALKAALPHLHMSDTLDRASISMQMFTAITERVS